MSVQIAELKAQKAASYDAARDLSDQVSQEDREMTPDEKQRFDGLMANYRQVGEKVSQLEQLEAARIELDVTTRKTKPATPEATPIRVQPEIRVMHSTRTLRSFDNHKDAYAAGRWLMALLDHAPSRQWCLERGMEFRALSEGINVKGGFLVPNEFERAIIKNRDMHGVIRANARVIPMSSDHIDVPVWSSGPTSYFIAEAGAFTPADTVYASVGVTAKKLGTLTYVSSELAEDAVIDIADDLAEDIGYQFALKEDQCGFIGDGTATYGGMVGLNVHIIDGTHEIGSVELAANHDLMSEVDVPDVMSVVGYVPEYALPNAKFYCSGVLKAAVLDRLKAAAGGATIVDGTVVANQFMGYPIVVSSIMPSAPLTDYTDEVMWLFGDMRKSTIFGDRRGIGIVVDPSYRMLNDQLTIRGIERFDIVNHALGDNTNAGPMVAGVGGT